MDLKTSTAVFLGISLILVTYFISSVPAGLVPLGEYDYGDVRDVPDYINMLEAQYYTHYIEKVVNFTEMNVWNHSRWYNMKAVSNSCDDFAVSSAIVYTVPNFDMGICHYYNPFGQWVIYRDWFVGNSSTPFREMTKAGLEGSWYDSLNSSYFRVRGFVEGVEVGGLFIRDYDGGRNNISEAWDDGIMNITFAQGYNDQRLNRVGLDGVMASLRWWNLDANDIGMPIEFIYTFNVFFYFSCLYIGLVILTSILPFFN